MLAEPYTDVTAHVRDELRRVWLRLEYQVRLGWRKESVTEWLGETEKNLSDVLDAAEPGHVVLLFNEADSLFGKCTADVCERAAYVAGADGAQIADALLRATIERMYRGRGKLSTVGPLE